MHINEFRIDLLEEIFSYLNIKEKFRYQIVCKHWQKHVFSCIKAITYSDAPPLQCRTHFYDKENQLSNEDIQNEEVMKLVFSKCGPYLLSFQGIVSSAIVQHISEHCVKLHCVNIEVIGEDTLELFIQKYLCRDATTCMQLTCAALSGDLTSGLNSFMAKCANLKSLSIESINLPPMSLPLSLEHLHLSIGYDLESFNSGEIGRAVVRLFETVLPKLKSLTIFLPEIRLLKIKPIMVRISNFQKIEDFTLCIDYVNEFDFDDDDADFDDDGDLLADKRFSPLLSMRNLKKLALPMGDELKLSDRFYLKLFAKLPYLTSLGGRDWRNDNKCSRLPIGYKFWRFIKDRAFSRPLEHFHLAGETIKDLNLCEPLPPNLTVGLEGNSQVVLSSGFGQSDHWLKLTQQSRHLDQLKIQIKDSNFNLSGLPTSVHTLRVSCFNDAEIPNSNALLFHTLLPNLKRLRIFQKIMTNQQLEATLMCVTAHCPRLKSLCLCRDNSEKQPIDKFAHCLLDCKSLKSLSVNKDFVYDTAFKRKMQANGKVLKRIVSLG